jgi:hypothetical protein
MLFQRRLVVVEILVVWKRLRGVQNVNDSGHVHMDQAHQPVIARFGKCHRVGCPQSGDATAVYARGTIEG